jgi:serine/threonine-protein phosphatase 6 regulatory ankyrin repeat subunit B
MRTKNKPNEDLFDAVESGDLELAKSALDRGADVNAVNSYCDTALMRASQYGYTNIVKLLLNRGANVNIKTDNGWTALMIASDYGYQGIVDLLELHWSKNKKLKEKVK